MPISLGVVMVVGCSGQNLLEQKSAVADGKIKELSIMFGDLEIMTAAQVPLMRLEQ